MLNEARVFQQSFFFFFFGLRHGCLADENGCSKVFFFDEFLLCTRQKASLLLQISALVNAFHLDARTCTPRGKTASVQAQDSRCAMCDGMARDSFRLTEARAEAGRGERE
ncbi:hypothetical protein TGVEG_289218 [Toxoplasma gondii VEG]|uniref:Secreted protein n=2 Tax=Toxoplasma gondii TaxID=5811 RepID=V5BEB8_TOXGV|nr:hypothetical protein TGVEG_289218 [Toxoplasma gondii VEG]